jgi:cell division septation protein DedD
VNEPSEATHYQIELTSRQVLGALVVLLVCLFAAFFSGVWIGRNAEADQAALELASVGQSARGGERFDFFSKTAASAAGGDEAGGAAAGAAASGKDAPAGRDAAAFDGPAAVDESDFGPDPDDRELDATNMDQVDPDSLFEDDPDEAALPPPEEMGRGGRRRRAAAREEDAAREEEEKAAAPAEPADSTRADASPPVATPAPPARSTQPAESGFHIQVLATGDKEKAEALVERLVDADFKAFIVPSNEGGRTVYRVRVGPFTDRDLATRQAAELESRWGLDSWISPGAP